MGTLLALDVALMALASFIFEFVLIGSRLRHDDGGKARAKLSNHPKGVRS